MGGEEREVTAYFNPDPNVGLIGVRLQRTLKVFRVSPEEQERKQKQNELLSICLQPPVWDLLPKPLTREMYFFDTVSLLVMWNGILGMAACRSDAVAVLCNLSSTQWKNNCRNTNKQILFFLV